MDWNNTSTELPRDKCVHELFETQVERTPEAVSVLSVNEKLTYRELNKRANQLAHRLRGLGVGPDVLVGLCVKRSIEMVIGLLGILKAGGAYVPIDPAYPKERLHLVLNDAQAAVLVTQDGLSRDLDLEVLNCAVICLDTPPGPDADYPLENPQSGVGPGNLSYVIHTSGSTGTPKGVEIEHRSLVNHMEWMRACYPVDREDRVLSRTSISFDAAVWEFWLPLISGAILCLPPTGTERDPDALADFMNRFGISIAQFVPTLLSATLDSGVSKPSNLRLVFAGGEVLGRELAEKTIGSWNVPIVNLFGPTETTIQVTHYLCRGKVPDTQTIPIGSPIWNAQIYILDRLLQPVPVGVPGEIYIGGEGVARGYHNRPELTAERFIPDPFKPELRNRLYRSGDLGRYLPDGNIEFLGRLDNQVKIRGFRIELGEIETALRQSEGVGEAVVVSREDGPGGRRLVAYVVGEHGGDPPEQKVLREKLQAKLPDYMVPSFFLFLDKLPLTQNGKVDRQALPPPGPQLKTTRPPRSPQEEILCGIFSEVLKVERVGIDDSFFALGGHSLMAIKLVNRVRETLGVDLDVRSVFEMPVVAQLVSCLQPAIAGHSPIVRRPRPERLPLSNAQKRLWFLDRLEGSSAEYNMAEAVRLQGELNVSALDRAINTLIERHETLRTRFEDANGQPFQIIEPAYPRPLEIEDLSAIAEKIRETALMAVLRQEAEKHFDLRTGPLFRIKVVRLGEHDHVLVWSCHHIISDGWSVAVFNREIALLYAAFCADRQNQLAPLPLQYADYALWQHDQLESAEWQALLTYWREQLADAPALELPTDRPRPSKPTHEAAHCSLFLPRHLTSQLKTLSREEKCTLFMSILAAFKVLLARHSGQEDISLGIPAVNRSRVEIEGLIGCFLNTLVLRTDLSGNITFRELMRRVRAVTLGAYAHADLPFEKLVEELGPERDLSRTPLFQVFLNFISIEDLGLRLPGLEAAKVELESSKAKFDLTLYAYERDASLFFVLVYNTDLFDASTAERMLSRFQVLLEAIVAQPDQPIGALPLLTPDERKAYTLSDNPVRPKNAYLEFPRVAIEHSIFTRFEEQAKNYASQTAIKTLAHHWTYAQLDRRANGVAREIRRLSREDNQRAALLLDHDAPMLAAILGCLKAGATYVPLSPSHPKERLARIISDAEPRLLVTDPVNEKLAGELSGGKLPLIDVEALPNDSKSLSGHVDSSPDTLAYLLYTSGSTGEPKGIAQSHRNVLHHIRNYSNSLHICARDRLLLLASYGFDAAVMDIFGALLNGATLLPFDIRKHDLVALSAWIEQEDVTIFHSTPSLFRHFVRAVSNAGALNKVRLVVLGGEPVLPHDLELFRERFSPECLLVNGYGQSEYSFSLQYFADRKTLRQSMPIGYPLDGTEVFLLDSLGRPDQVFGEIAIRSPYLARGYWRRPELTALAFQEDPDEGTTYRTGDLGRLRADGTIEFAGRKDFQVKIRGNRVELGEIETVLHRHAQLESAVVVARHSNEDEVALAAYVVPREGASVSAHELRDFLAKSLPDYMVPAAFVMLDQLPLTPNGKIDRKALPRPERSSSDFPPVSPRTPFEITLAGIWKELLHLENIGVRDDFFERGGHSLAATRLASQIRERLKVEIPLRVLFEKRTIEDLALYIAELEALAAAPDEIEELLAELETLP